MDVLEGGTGGSRPRRAWLVAWIVALTAAGTYATVRGNGAGDTGRAAPPAVSPISGQALPPSPPAPAPSWPSAAGACGTTAHRPLTAQQQLTVRTGVRLLVGGYGLRLVDADTGAARPTAGLPISTRQTVTKLVSARDKVYALSTECDGAAGRIYRVEGGAARPVPGAAAVDLVAGAGRVWAVHHPDPTAGVVLRLLGNTRSLTLPSRAYPVADSDAGLVVATTFPDPDDPPRIVVHDPTGTRPPRSLGNGEPLAVGRTDLLRLDPGCATGDAASSCTITRVEIRTGQVRGHWHLPNGRVPVGPGTLSGEGDRVAFQLSRLSSDPRFDPGHPIPPSEIVVLRLDDGPLETIPGLELAPKTGAGLVFAGTGSWLFVSVSHGDHSHLYAWRPGVRGPLRIARLPGPVTWAPPLLSS